MTTARGAAQIEVVAEAVDAIATTGNAFTRRDVWQALGGPTRSWPSYSRVETVVVDLWQHGLIRLTNPGHKAHQYVPVAS